MKAQIRSLTDTLRIGCLRVLREDDGLLTFVHVVTVAFLALLIGFVGNLGWRAQEKVEVQNGVDATARSAAVLAARGMNSVTALNHLMGEATAMVVNLDGIGVPDRGEEVDLSGDVEFSAIDSALITTASNMGFDTAFLTTANENINSTERPRYGAALYDADMQVRRTFDYCLSIKRGASALSLGVGAVPVFGQVVAIAMQAVHLAANAVILQLVQEAYVLQAATEAVPVLQGVKSVIRETYIPLLGAAIREIAEPNGKASGELRQGLENVTAELRREHRLTESILVPSPKEFLLPVRAEPAPGSATSGGGQQEVPPGPRLPDDRTGLANEILKPLDFALSPISKIVDWIKNVSSWLPLNSEAQSWINKALRFFQVSRSLPTEGRYPNNPSLKSLKEIPWEAEATSQWSRASYPSMDGMRAAFRKLFVDVAPLSNLGGFHVYWTERFHLETCWELRSGQPPTGQPGGFAGSGGNFPVPQMYVMVDSSPDHKGHEPWTGDARLAESHFGFLAIGRRDGRAPWGAESVFGGDPDKTVAMAASMFYNANGRRIEAMTQNTQAARQPDTGWDTLNWTPPVRAPEWGGQTFTPPRGSVWSLFSGREDLPPTARVKLNWQGRLAPISVQQVERLQRTSDGKRLLGRESLSPQLLEDVLHH